MKQLTIAVPSYNMEKLLPQCLDSMADERLESALEVVIVDDGSSDGTARIAQEYARRYPGIFSVISKENGGHGSAVNAALRQATGRYFRIVDADDWVNTDNLVRLLEVLKNTDADLVLDEKTEVDMQTGKETYFSFPKEMPSGCSVPFEEIAAPEFRYHLALHTMSVRTELLITHHVCLLEHTFYVDAQFILQATAFAETALVLRMGMYYYRVGNAAQSVHYLNYVKRYEEHDRMLAACLDFFKRAEFADSRREYVAYSLKLLVHTQYNIALIFQPDRKSGRIWARRLRDKLLKEYAEIAQAADRRYKTALLMNRLGIGYREMMKIKSMMRK